MFFMNYIIPMCKHTIVQNHISIAILCKLLYVVDIFYVHHINNKKVLQEKETVAIQIYLHFLCIFYEYRSLDVSL